MRRVIEQMSPMLRGWLKGFALGHAGQCFPYVRNWVDQKVRRHWMRGRNRPRLR